MKTQKLVLVAIVGSVALLAWWVFSLAVRAEGNPPLPTERASLSRERGGPSGWGLPAHRDTAKVTPGLLRQILDAAPSVQHRAIIELASEADLEAIPNRLSREAQRAEAVRRLRATALESQAELLTLLEAGQQDGRVQRYEAFWVFNGVAVTADGATLLALATRPDVRLIRPDRWRRWLEPPQTWEMLASPGPGGSAVEWNIARIEADRAWQNLGLDGSGVTVAIMDTGVDWQHPALQAQYRGYRPGGPFIHEGNWLCTTDEGYLYPVDGYGHGTHVAGLAVGGQDADGNGIGVAPGAQWIAVKMLSDDGYGYDSWIHAAFEWLLAPAGDPGLAPDVVNGSWGAPVSNDETFRPDVQALRAAGIVPVFSAGNDGPGSGSLHSPGSFPEALTVGATDDVDQVASFSSRGPSPWGETKPEICAPGTQVRSSLPGGTYGTHSGTSMAAPHVAGTAALVLQADGALSVEAVEGILTLAAKPVGQSAPNNDCGWGRVNAYQAAATALQAGYLTGKVTRQSDQAPLGQAHVVALDHEGQQVALAQSDDHGEYWMAVAAGQYDVEFSAFGFAPQVIPQVLVQPSVTVTLDVSLVELPQGILWGIVSSADTGEPVAAELSLLDTPRSTLSDPSTGFYSFTLPAGTYTLTARHNGHRRHSSANVAIEASEQTELDVDLTPAPTLILVDSGRWYYGSQAAYLGQALADGDYVFDVWEIRDRATDVPSADDLSDYEITIWSAPLDSPGLVGAGEIISTYLTAGGDMFLSGQDVGYWDGGLEGSTESYYAELLKARAVSDDAGRDDIVGLPGRLLGGLTLPMNGPDSAGNQLYPDAIEVADPRRGSLVAEYTTGLGACLQAAGCQSYQAVYMAAGLEALGDRPSRAEVMDRVIQWLASQQPTVGVELYPPLQTQVWLQDRIVTYTIEILNQGAYPDRFSLELSETSWPSELRDGGFGQPITQTGLLGKCQTQTVGLEVTIPAEVAWNARDALTLTARSQSDPSIVATATFRTKAPAPILLVDDHRWYSTLASYQSALEANGLPFDVWATDPTWSAERESVSTRRLQRYPVVIWFTAYDWYSTLTEADERNLQDYLDGGGRLFLSSQDYLFTNGLSELAVHYLGVAGFTESLTATQVVVSAASPVAAGPGPYELDYPFRNWSDALQATSRSRPLFWGQHGQPVALSTDYPPWKAVYAAMPLEALQPPDRTEMMGHLVAWLSPLGDSAMTADRRVAAQGEEVGYTLAIRNSGPAELSNVTMTNRVPISTTYVSGSLEGPAVYDPDDNAFNWSGSLARREAITVSYRLALDDALADATGIVNVAHLSDESGLGIEPIAIVRVNAPDLSASLKRVHTGFAVATQMLTYTLSLQNHGLRPASAVLVDPVPPWTTLAPGTGRASSGDLELTPGGLQWTGPISPGHHVTITCSAIITRSANDVYVLNRAVVDDGSGMAYPLEASTWVENRRYLPLVYRHP